MIEAIRELFAAGVDCGVESYQGVGVLAWIVTPGQRRMERCFALSELETINEWLLAEAVGSKSAELGLDANRNPRDLLAELAESRRKDPRRVSIEDRHERLGKQAGQHQLAG